MTPFRTLPKGPITLKNLTVPACLVGMPGYFYNLDLSIKNGKMTEEPTKTVIDMKRAMVMPAFIDMHTHLDKGHIWPRKPNPNGTFDGALNAVAEDRSANWNADDVQRRMDFSLRCAYAHGTKAIRTHLDSIIPQAEISWPVFREMRQEWKGRIELQAVCLVAVHHTEPDAPFRATADLVAESGGVLGLVTQPVQDLPDRLRSFLRMAERRNLPVDFHVDETLSPSWETLRDIAQAVIDTGFEAPVVVGHCCSLSTQNVDRAMDTLDLVAKAGINVVSLPMCNLYLQDRRLDQTTPRRRGVTLVHEMRARGIPVSFASDNTRDPFYAYGDMDMVEVMREATRVAHLDHNATDWMHSFFSYPALACGFDLPEFGPGAPADLVICNARNWTELFSRPQADRIVMRKGKVIDRTLPDYSELDDLMEPA